MDPSYSSVRYRTRCWGGGGAPAGIAIDTHRIHSEVKTRLAIYGLMQYLGSGR